MSSLGNTVKTFTLLAALGGLLVFVGGLLGGRGGMVIALLFAVAMNGFVYWKSDSLALRANGARELQPGELPRFRSIVSSLAARAGLPMPRLYIIDRPEPNAFATGRNPEHAAVAVTTGILDLMDDRQLTGVLAKVEWSNPHTYFYLDVKDSKGEVSRWALESFGPAQMRRTGLSRAGLFETGHTYTVTVCGAKDGSKNLAWIKDFTFPDGHKVTIWWGDPKDVN